MNYQLKPNQEAFKVVDGPHAGKQFKRGQVYEEIPPQEKHRFEKVKVKVQGSKFNGSKQNKLNKKPGTKKRKDLKA